MDINPKTIAALIFLGAIGWLWYSGELGRVYDNLNSSFSGHHRQVMDP